MFCSSRTSLSLTQRACESISVATTRRLILPHRMPFNCASNKNLVTSTSPTQSATQTRQYSSATPEKAFNMASATSFFGFETKDKRGQSYPLSQHQGKVILAVNTASKCGFTPQFGDLETLWKKVQANEKYKDDFLILGFPCNQFGGQDPGSDDTIQEFCQLNYGVSFPVLAKTEVNGNNAEPVWEWMKSEKPGLMGLKRIKWNFEKFLIGRDGKVVNRWASVTNPKSLESIIMEELQKPKPASA